MEELNKWLDKEIKDDFGDSTGEKIQLFKTEGTFSNQDLFEAKLLVTIRNQKSKAVIFIYDELMNELINVNELQYDFLSFKREDGSKDESGIFYSPEGFLEIDTEGDFLSLLNNGKSEKIKVVITNKFNKIGSEKYSFSFITSDKVYIPKKVHSPESSGGCASIIVVGITITSILSLIL